MKFVDNEALRETFNNRQPRLVYLYRFSFDGAVKYDACRIVSIGKHRISSYPKADERVRIAFEPIADKSYRRGYVFFDEIDRKATISGGNKLVVLSKPDFELAKSLAIEAVEESIESKLADVDRMHDGLKALRNSELF